MGTPFTPVIDPIKLVEQAQCFPYRLGKDERQGHDLKLVYFCAGLCPDQGEVLVRYAGVSQKACCEIGGYILRDSAFPAQLGCAAPENPSLASLKSYVLGLDNGSTWFAQYPCSRAGELGVGRK